MKELRPIGTIFKCKVPPSFSCTEVRWSYITYEIVAHPMCQDGKKREELKPINIEYFEPEDTAIIFKDGDDIRQMSAY